MFEAAIFPLTTFNTVSYSVRAVLPNVKILYDAWNSFRMAQSTSRCCLLLRKFNVSNTTVIVAGFDTANSHNVQEWAANFDQCNHFSFCGGSTTNSKLTFVMLSRPQNADQGLYY